MRCLLPLSLSLGLLSPGTATLAADAAPKAAVARKAQPGTAASAATTAPAPGTAPNAGGSGGGIGSNKGTSGQQIGPKKPKCPDPTARCPVEKAVGP